LNRKPYVALAIAFLILIAVVRILLTYNVTAQGFDEPCHVAAAIEYLNKGTYTLDPVHPPLSRMACSLRRCSHLQPGCRSHPGGRP